jgi:hypothetical protein
MKTLTYTDARYATGRELVFLPSLRPAICLRRLRHYIETSDWDERMIRKGPVVDKICLVILIVSSITLFPLIVGALLK